MKILFLGDIIGKPGRDAVAAELPQLKARLQPDLPTDVLAIIPAERRRHECVHADAANQVCIPADREATISVFFIL